MSQQYKPIHYSAAGIRLMSDMFEQQMRIAHAMGAVAFVAHPMLLRGPYSGPQRRTDAAQQAANAATCARTHSLPV